MQSKSILYLLFILLVIISCDKDEPLRVTCSEATTTCDLLAVDVDTTRIHRKVLIIGIDGFRAEAMQQSITPNLFQLSQHQNTYYTDQNIVEDLTFSGPNWGSLCTGVHWCKHKIESNDYANNQLDEYPHFFSYIEEVRPDLNTASVVNWTPINTYSAKTYADYAPEESLNDDEVYQVAAELLNNQIPLNPNVLFLHFDEADGTGHTYGYSSEIPEYRTVLTAIDAHVGNLLNIIETKRQNGENWLICVVSDHGGDGTGHGGGQDNDFINKTIFFANSPDVNFVENYVSSQVDLVPTILDYIGIQHFGFDCKTDGVSLIL